MEVEGTWRRSSSSSKAETIVRGSYLVQLIGVLATAAGKRRIELEARDGIPLSELISSLVLQVNNRQFTELLMDSATNNPLPNVIILLNDQDCNLFQGMTTRLDPSTVVTIIPVAHGG